MQVDSEPNGITMTFQPPDGAAAVDAATAELDGLDELPVAEHVERFDAVHVALTTALSGIDKV